MQCHIFFTALYNGSKKCFEILSEKIFVDMTSGMRNVGPSFSICKINDDVLNEWLEEMEE